MISVKNPGRMPLPIAASNIAGISWAQRVTLFMACFTFGLGPAVFAQQVRRLPVTGLPPVASITRGGVILGYVFWPTNAAQYNHATPCSQLKVRVVPRSEGGTFHGEDDDLTHVGVIGGYEVCAYRIQGVPEGQDMHMLFLPNSPGFTPSLTFDMAPVDRQFPKYYINIPGGACNQTVSTTPTVSELTASGWWPCGDNAYDVNFGVYPPIDGARRVTSISTTPVSGPVHIDPGTSVESGASKGMLLTPGSQQTMLGGGSSVGNGGSGAGAMQRQAITDGTVTGGARPGGAPQVGASETMSATQSGASSRTAVTTPPGAAANGPLLAAPSKSPGRNEYDAVTLDRGVTHDTEFQQWANTSAAARTPQRPAAGAQHAPNEGVIEGFVYWNASTIKHSPPDSCSGLSVTVSYGGTTLVTMTNNFAYMGNVGTDAVCKYAVKGLVPDVDLQVQANVTSSTAFSPLALPSGGQSVKISVGSPLCAPGPVDPSQSDLAANWGTCADIAYNVNFVLVSARGLTPMGTRAPIGIPGRAVELSPQPYPPKNGTLLAPDPKKTLIGDGSVGNGGSGMPTVQRQAITDGTLAGGVRPATAPKVGQRQTMSATVNSAAPGSATQGVAIASTLHTENNPASMTRAPAESASLGVALACAKDPTFRILGINGSPDGVTMAIGHQYTILGCSFGNLPNAKAPKSANSPAEATPSNMTPPRNTVLLSFGDGGNVWPPLTSWSDNSVVVTIPYAPEGAAGTSLPVNLTVVRLDNQSISKDGFKYQIPGPPPGPPAASVALAVQSCTQDNTFRIAGVYPTYGSGPASELRPDAYYTIAGCSFGTAGGKSAVVFTGGYGPYGNYVYGTHYVLAPTPRSWSDTQIVIFVDQADLPSSVPVGVWPSIVEGDAYPLTVSIVRADGTQVIKPGFTFLLKP